MSIQRDDNMPDRPRFKPIVSGYWGWFGFALFIVAVFLPAFGPTGEYARIWVVGYLIAATIAAVIMTTLVELGRRSPSSSQYPDAVAPYPYAQLTLRSLFKTTLSLSIVFGVVARLEMPVKGRSFLMLLAGLAVLGYYICGQLVRRLSPRPQLPK